MPWSGAWTTPQSNVVPPDATGPFPILIPAEQPPREQSRLVLAGVAAALVVGLVLAVFSLRDFGSDDEERSSAVAPLTSTSDTQTSEPDASAVTRPAETPPAPSAQTPSETKKPAASTPEIEKIRSIDPMADGSENNEDTPNAVDGVDSTMWTTDTYNSSSFGGLKKGLGLAIRLKDATVISAVELDMKGSGGKIELRGGPSADYQKSEVLDSASASGTVTLKSTSKDTFKYVIIWITQVPKTGGEYRAEVSEVRVT